MYCKQAALLRHRTFSAKLSQFRNLEAPATPARRPTLLQVNPGNSWAGPTDRRRALELSGDPDGVSGGIQCQKPPENPGWHTPTPAKSRSINSLTFY